MRKKLKIAFENVSWLRTNCNKEREAKSFWPKRPTPPILLSFIHPKVTTNPF